jgi:hypothetical protein
MASLTGRKIAIGGIGIKASLSTAVAIAPRKLPKTKFVLEASWHSVNMGAKSVSRRARDRRHRPAHRQHDGAGHPALSSPVVAPAGYANINRRSA